MEDNIQASADRIWNSIQSGETCSPVRELIGESDQEAAYKAQQINTQRKLDQGHRIVGCKIGLTSFAVQKQLGVDQPDFGVLTDRMQIANGGEVRWAELMQPKAEAEIAFVLKADLVGSITMDSLKEAIDYAAASIEIVGSRIEGWNIRITDTIADNASASHFVLSDSHVSIESLDLENCQMSMTRAGEVVSSGEGKACLGNPLNAALWLAQTMQRLGTPLKEGDIILAGALGPMVNANQGDRFEATIEGLGSVSVSFGMQS
ncbi:MAG: fumarylacetoacetate hydrolase family protein [Flavobacteriales bacterium]